MRTLIQPRTRGLSGPFFKRGNSIVNGYIKAPSAFYSEGGAGSGPVDPFPNIPFVATAVADGVWKALQKAATGTAVYSARDSVATVIDHEGLVREVPDYTIRPQNARIVENLIRDSDHPYSEDLSLWYLNSAVTPVFTPEKGWLIENATPGNAADIQCRNIGLVNSLVHIGDVVIARVRFGSLSFVGTVVIKIQEYNGGTYNTQSLINITDVVDGNVYTLTHTISDATTNNIRLIMQAASGHTGSLYANFAQVEKVTGASVQDAPSEYVSVGVGTMEHGLFVDGIKAFATSAHNNSVTSGVVTEGTASGDISDNIDYLAEPRDTNKLTYSADFSQWTKRGSWTLTLDDAADTPLVSISGNAAKLESLGTIGVNDTYLSISGVTADTFLSVAIYIKAITTGTLTIGNPGLGTRGNWAVDLSALSGWERITEDHPAVTIVSAFQATGAGTAGIHLYADSGTISFYADGAMLSESDTVQSYINTSGAPVIRSADLVKFDYAGNFNQDAGTVILDWTPQFDYEDDPGGSLGLFTTRVAGFGQIYNHGNSGLIASYDLTNLITKTVNWVEGTIYRIGLCFDGDGINLAWRALPAGSWSTWGSGPYDGSFGGLSFIHLAFDSKGTGISNVKSYLKNKGTDWIEANY